MIFALVNIFCIFMLVTDFVREQDAQTEKKFLQSLRGVGKMFDGDSVITPIRLYPYPGGNRNNDSDSDSDTDDAYGETDKDKKEKADS